MSVACELRGKIHKHNTIVFRSQQQNIKCVSTDNVTCDSFKNTEAAKLWFVKHRPT